jgi:hypothetical protein
MKILVLIFLISLPIIVNGQTKKSKTVKTVSKSVAGNTQKKDAQPVKIIESWHMVKSLLDDKYLKWAVILENPNQDYLGSYFTITATARDENGAVAGTEDQIIAEIPPGAKIAWCGSFEVTQNPHIVEFTIPKVTWKKTTLKPDDFKQFLAEKVTFKMESENDYTILGDIKNPFNSEISSLFVTTLMRDINGKIVGGATNSLRSLPPNGSRPFSYYFVSTSADSSKVEVFAMPSGLSSWSDVVNPK